MEYRRLGSTEIQVSAVGFGTWPIGGTHYGPSDEEQAILAIQKALEIGINCFDSAPTYGRGHAEELLGKALGSRRKDVVIVTKCGMTWDPNEPRLGGPSMLDSSPAAIHRMVERSLKLLQTDYIDVYLVHWPDPAVPLQETMRAMEELRQSGKVRYICVSNFRVDHMRECLRWAKLNVLQVGYNLFDRRQEPDTLPFCLNQDIGVMAFGPLAHGLLTGTFTSDTTFVDWDWRKSGNVFGQRLFTADNFRRNLEVVDQLREIAEERNVSLPNLALGWVLHHPAVGVALVGARTAYEVETTQGALGCKLSPEDLERIDRIIGGAAGTSWILPESKAARSAK